MGIIGNTKSKEYQGFFLSLELGTGSSTQTKCIGYSLPLLTLTSSIVTRYCEDNVQNQLVFRYTLTRTFQNKSKRKE